MKHNKKLHLAVFISGNGSNLQAIIDAIENKKLNATIEQVISNQPEAYGLKRAEKAGIKNSVINHQNFLKREDFEEELIQKLKDTPIHYIVLAGFMRRLSPHFLNAYPEKILNIHPSLLPKYKGLNTHQQVLDNQDKEHGCSIHIVTEHLDDGPVLAQAKITVEPNDTLESLQKKVQQQEHLLYPSVLERLAQSKM